MGLIGYPGLWGILRLGHASRGLLWMFNWENGNFVSVWSNIMDIMSSYFKYEKKFLLPIVIKIYLTSMQGPFYLFICYHVTLSSFCYMLLAAMYWEMGMQRLFRNLCLSLYLYSRKWAYHSRSLMEWQLCLNLMTWPTPLNYVLT